MKKDKSDAKKFATLKQKVQQQLGIGDGSTTKSQKTTTSSVHKNNNKQSRLKF